MTRPCRVAEQIRSSLVSTCNPEIFGDITEFLKIWKSWLQPSVHPTQFRALLTISLNPQRAQAFVVCIGPEILPARGHLSLGKA